MGGGAMGRTLAVHLLACLCFVSCAPGHRAHVSAPSTPLFAPTSEPFGPALKARVVDEIGQVLKAKAYAGPVDFNAWGERARQAQPSLDQAETPEAFALALNCVLEGFRVSHLQVITAQQRATTKLDRRYGFRTIAQPDGALVVEVLGGSGAERAGLQRGDLLTMLEGQPYDSMRLAPCARANGPAHIQGLRRGRPRAWEIACAPVRPLGPPSLSWANPQVALLRIPSFEMEAYDSGMVQRFFSQIASAKGLIIDLRGNGGGDFSSFRHLATHLWSGGNKALGYAVNRAQARRGPGGEAQPEASALREGMVLDFVGNRGPHRFAGVVTVLTDAWTASSAELFAAGMQDWGRAKVIGTVSAGALLGVRRDGQADWGCPLSGEFQLLYPVEVLLTPKVRALEGRGVTPDVVLDARSTADDEQIVGRAVEAMSLS